MADILGLSPCRSGTACGLRRLRLALETILKLRKEARKWGLRMRSNATIVSRKAKSLHTFKFEQIRETRRSLLIAKVNGDRQGIIHREQAGEFSEAYGSVESMSG